MKSDDERQGAASVSRARIIAEAQARTHDARMQFIESANSIEQGAHENLAAAQLHNAVIEYFYALRPLKDEPPVRQFWNEVVLWEEAESGETKKAKGFDRLEQEAVRFQTTRSTSKGYLGTRTEVNREPIRLPPDVLLRISAKLDQAAGKLGFLPETDDEIMSTILEEESDATIDTEPEVDN